MKNKTKSLLLITAAAAAGMYVYNRYISDIADEMNQEDEKNGSFYSWKEGEIFYKKIGTGKPILLVHDLDSASSSNEWQKVARKLSTTHTVYMIDLLGCGKSDKPAISYTTYLYVQLVTSFIKDVIQEKTDVIATHLSTPFIIMANQMDSEIMDKIILINPVSMKQTELIPDQISKLKKAIINLPLVGTFLYHRMNTPIKMNLHLETKCFKNADHISTSMRNSFYSSAHSKNGQGKYLFSSILGNFLCQDMKHALKNMNKPVLIIASNDLHENSKIIEGYEKLNSQFSSIYLSGTKLYPHLEYPDKVLKILETKL